MSVLLSTSSLCTVQHKLYLWKTSRKWMLHSKGHSQSSVFEKDFIEHCRGFFGTEIWNSVALWCLGVVGFWVGLFFWGVGVPAELSTHMEYKNFVLSFVLPIGKKPEMKLLIWLLFTSILPSPLSHLLHWGWIHDYTGEKAGRTMTVLRKWGLFSLFSALVIPLG